MTWLQEVHKQNRTKLSTICLSLGGGHVITGLYNPTGRACKGQACINQLVWANSGQRVKSISFSIESNLFPLLYI